MSTQEVIFFLMVSFLFISVSLLGMQNSLSNNRREVSFSPALGDTDEYGYYWIDSNEPGGPTFNWIDITAIGTKVYGLSDDNNVGPFAIGFDFPYYGFNRNQFYVNSNGAISFTDVEPYIPQGASGYFIPSSYAPNDLLIPFGADLIFEGVDTAECYYYTNNIDTFIVSYIKVPGWEMGQPLGTHTFQLILTRQDSCIYFQYGKHYQSYSFLNCAGIEDASGSIGLQVFYWNRPDSGYVVKFVPPDSISGVNDGKGEKKSYVPVLLSAYPNPSKGNTKICYSLPNNSDISLKVYNLLGQEIRILENKKKLAGKHTISWDGTDNSGKRVSGGVYFLRLKMDNFSVTKKLCLMKK